jgi:hypothetical protein
MNPTTLRSGVLTLFPPGVESAAILITFVNLTHDVGKRSEDQAKSDEGEE